jgi:tRNA pseudouridine38-40 synthase
MLDTRNALSTFSGVSPPAPTRFGLLIQYDGAPYSGWQLQPDMPTVQGEIEAVLERLTGARRPVVASGRTDQGVHALGQVASVDLPAKWNADRLRKALNALLPGSIWIQEVRRVPADFHPRFDARRRSYLYRLGTAAETASPFHHRWCWPPTGRPGPVDPEGLAAAASLIPGDRAFGAFAKAGQPERGERCRVLSAEWRPWEDLGYVFQITADRYLHRMVRYLVGTMADVARGGRPLDEMAELLEDPNTALRTSPPAPPEGLFLHRVSYDAARVGDDPDRAPRNTNTDWS